MNSEDPSQPSQLTDFMPVQTAAREPLPSALQSGNLLRMALVLLTAGCGLSLLAVLVFHPGSRQANLPALAMLLPALAALASLRLPVRRLSAAFSLCATAAVLAITATAYSLGWGLTAPALWLLPLLVLGAAAAASARLALAVGVLAAGSLGWLWWQTPAGLTSSATLAAPQAGHLLALQLLGLALAGWAGRLLYSSLLRQRTLYRQRETRYRGLLALVADAYWELDAEYRLMAGVLHRETHFELTPQNGLGAVPWRLPCFVWDADTLDRLQACLDARLPFRDQPVAWQTQDGRELQFLVSGEPRFGERGQFTGYWGVARDISTETTAHQHQHQHQHQQATETRYEELFERIPTPLLLHRRGQIIEANPAALALFGAKTHAELCGKDVLSFYESGDSRDRARRRIAELETMPLGTALPVTEFRLRTAKRSLWLRATGVRVAAPGGPATLAMYIDDSERRQAEEAVRRSEALLQHLVATSPDLITLTDFATGRYVMVNQAFERRSGYSAAEAIGRTSLELGVWRSAEQRAQFVQMIQEQGSVAHLPVHFTARSGEEVPLRVSAARFVMDQRDYLVINARDVAEQERDRLEREAILANASVGIAVTRERAFVLANRHFETLFGWQPGAIIGQPGSIVWHTADDYEAVGQQVRTAFERHEPIEIERQARRHDGSSFLARIRGCPIDLTGPANGGTIWIVEDVSQRHKSELALARARDDAEAANRAKSAFLANTSHELRTPLNGIVGLAYLARAPDLDASLRQQYLDQMSDSAQTLAQIVSDILDVSKIEAGKLQLDLQAFDLPDLLHSLHRSWGTLAAARGLGLELELGPDLSAQVWGDPLRLRQVLDNYLSNALKFTTAGSVKLHVRRLSADTVRLDVHDTGPGLAADVQQRLFQPFTQADQSTTRRHGGTGLGLSICRELTTLMGGSVGVNSQVGQGSCFWAELPLPVTVPAAMLSSAPADAPPVAWSAPRAGGRINQQAAPPSPVQPHPNLRGRSVLIVEDNAVNMLIAVAMMESWGLRVAQALDGEQALGLVQRAFDEGRPFDAVLMDVQMPQMSGHEATQALRRTQAGAHLPIIALTAAALTTEREIAFSAGMNDFLTKPVDAARLAASLERWVLPVAR